MESESLAVIVLVVSTAVEGMGAAYLPGSIVSFGRNMACLGERGT
jgi:hypothetical protein